MKGFDHSAIYIMCDGSMAYDAVNSGGVGYVIKFPEGMHKEEISGYSGVYVKANIERLELQAIVEGMEALFAYLKKGDLYVQASRIVVITDRQVLGDDERTSRSRIKAWRSNKGKNHEGKEIKNWDLLNKLDKTRTRLERLTGKC